MIKRVAAVLLGAIVLVFAAVALRAATVGSRQVQVAAVAAVPLDAQAVARRLGEAVRLRTIAAPRGPASADAVDPNAAADEPNRDAFVALHALLARHYPAAHAAMRRETINGLTLLYTWAGRDASARPIVLMAHQDVVPVAPGTERDWTVPPFSGEVRDGFVWGRGAWDDKGNLVAMMEAVESLAAAGAAPARTVLLVFGHDEEVGGQRGARAVAQLLAERGVRPEFVLDEGLLVTEGVLAGLDRPAALVGVAEKGYLTLQLTAHATPGHSSMPPARTAIGALAGALARLVESPAPAGLHPLAREMLDTLAPEMAPAQRAVLSNLWLTGPLVARQLQGSPSTAALLRTTAAPTVLAAGNADNVLPGQARALVNFRLLPGDAADAVQRRAADAVGDASIAIERQPGWSEASRVSGTDAPGYRAIAQTLRELHTDFVVAPGLMLGATDSRHFEPIADQVYRFSPVRAHPRDLARFHGTDERISVANLAELVQFYRRLLVNAASAAAGRP